MFTRFFRAFLLPFLLLTLVLTALALSACAPMRIVGMDAPALPQNDNLQLGSQVVKTAMSQMGKPYRLGGESPQKGFDCSGLIYWAYRQNGVSMPRITTQQANIGSPVNRQQLVPGDILIFRTTSAPNGLHTAIYTGYGKFIHSPNKKSRVRLDSLNTPYWSKSYRSARRVVPSYADR